MGDNTATKGPTRVNDDVQMAGIEAGNGPALKAETSNYLPLMNPIHTGRGSMVYQPSLAPTADKAAVLSRRMGSTTFIGRLDPAKDPLAAAKGNAADEEAGHGSDAGSVPHLTPLERFVFNMQKCLCEFFATMIIVSAVAFGLSKEGGGQAAPFSITSTIFALITLFKDISGAHFNPAVSFTIFMTDPRFTFMDLVSYVGAQLAGAIAGAFIGYGIMGKALDILPLDPGMSASRQLFHEVIPTMVMVYAVLSLVFGYGVMWELTIPFVVGACVLAGALAGATMNPAVTFGIFISNVSTENKNIDVDALMVTLFGPFLGAMFAFVGYIATHAYHNPVPLRFLNFKGV
ncbi:aquaporin 1 [Cystoisospora suis]|uniref:Aquaporin 1 n=1 Tax=Cystoisospora suis TaxID=483139 RepID=A0A2C6KZZ4_9APIC|nr:aquaporin 1 [Cystoisospora suis]